MFYIKVHDTINKIISFYYKIGIWKDEEKTRYHKWGRKLFHLLVSAVFFASLITGSIQSDQWDESIFLAAEGLSIGIVLVKVIFILWKKDEILYFLPTTGDHCITDRETFTQIEKRLKMFINFVTVFCTVIYLDNLACVIMGLPIFSDEKKLAIQIAFPLDWKNTEIGFWTAYVYLIVTIAFHCAYIFITVIVWYIMLNCSIKYQILEMQFKNLGTIRSTIPTEIATVTKRKISEEKRQSLYLQDLVELIKTHRSIQAMIDRFKTCFEMLFFAQISTSGVCICGSVYALGFSSHQDLYQSAVYIILTMYNFFDIFMVMYFGNEIKLFSGRLSYGLFQSDWINQSKSCKKCILILMEFLKQPHELVIGVLYPLNLETFTSILNFAYSSFNILKSFK